MVKILFKKFSLFLAFPLILICVSIIFCSCTDTIPEEYKDNLNITDIITEYFDETETEQLNRDDDLFSENKEENGLNEQEENDINILEENDNNELENTFLQFPNLCINLFNDEGEKFELVDVTKDNYVTSEISLTNTEEEFEFSSISAGFKGRGNGSWLENKKGYKIKFDKKRSLFGREKNKHWVLNPCSNFDDRTLFKNYLAYNITNEILDAIEYTTNAVWVNLYINEEYHGVYLLCEHVRVDKGRVDIESKYAELDTGYLIEYDAWATGTEGIDYFIIDGVKYPFTVHSPDPEECLEQDEEFVEQYKLQVDYIRNYTANTYSAALNHDFETFSTYADVNSFVDMFILHELFKNTDTGYSSFYLYKKKNGKLYAGPAWDFDATAMSSRGDSSPEGIYVAEKVLEASDFTASELFIALYNTPEFKNLIIQRWNELSEQLLDYINTNMSCDFCESIKLEMAQNFALWDNVTLDIATENWINSVEALKNWFNARITFLNEEWSINQTENVE